jgi:DNA-binding NarL/FixJ family response regulator
MIEILIVDDQKTVQETLKTYIEEESDFKIVGYANNGKEAIDLIRMHQPHIVLMDIEMPVMDGLTATQIISEQFLNTNVLILSTHNEDNYLNMAVQVGAKGYLKKNTSAKEMVGAIYSAYKGYFQLGPGLLEQYLHKITELQSNYSRSSSRRSDSNKEDQTGDTNNKVNTLEAKFYQLSRRFEQLNKHFFFLQKFLIVLILCNAFVVLLFLLFSY